MIARDILSRDTTPLSQKPRLGENFAWQVLDWKKPAANDCRVREKSEIKVRLTSGKPFPGQYYDQETGLYQNYYRDYDPATGRYITSDPIGLVGGLNTYLYANANPIRFDDPFGLTTYSCRRPLGGKPGDQRNGPDIPGNPAYHQYNCVTTPNGIQCQSTNAPPGYADTAWPKRDPGVPSDPSDDYYDSKSCDVREDDGNDCIEKCLMKKWQQPRPPYGIGPTGTDCQEYSDNTYMDCMLSCKKNTRRGRR